MTTNVKVEIEYAPGAWVLTDFLNIKKGDKVRVFQDANCTVLKSDNYGNTELIAKTDATVDNNGWVGVQWEDPDVYVNSESIAKTDSTEGTEDNA